MTPMQSAIPTQAHTTTSQPTQAHGVTTGCHPARHEHHINITPSHLSLQYRHPLHKENRGTEVLMIGCWRYTFFCWVGKNMYKYYYETAELPNPRPTQSTKTLVKSGIWANFFPQQIFFRWLGLVLYRNQTTRNLTQSNSPQRP